MNDESKPRIPLIGEKAPAFKAVTTQGESIFRRITRENGSFCSATRPTSRPSARPSL